MTLVVHKETELDELQLISGPTLKSRKGRPTWASPRGGKYGIPPMYATNWSNSIALFPRMTNTLSGTVAFLWEER